ncbi:MAG: DUF1854 domain-containing protein [Fimbriiglobus sp.]
MDPFRLEHDAFGRLVLVAADGTRHPGVDPVRAFPITAPREHVTIVDPDGKEIVTVPKLDDLPADTRQILEDELARRHFLPVVRRVVRITGVVEPVECEAETDRGTVTFQIQGEENVMRLPGGRVLIADANGVRYLIPDVDALDAPSRRLLERYV